MADATFALARRRESVLPNVPTVGEAGYPAATTESWMGLVAPHGARVEAVQAIAHASAKILSSPEYRTALERISMRPTGSTPDEFTSLLQREHERCSPILRTARIKLD